MASTPNNGVASQNRSFLSPLHDGKTLAQTAEYNMRSGANSTLHESVRTPVNAPATFFGGGHNPGVKEKHNSRR
jgi:hypothetical protein